MTSSRRQVLLRTTIACVAFVGVFGFAFAAIARDSCLDLGGVWGTAGFGCEGARDSRSLLYSSATSAAALSALASLAAVGATILFSPPATE